ncbi:restriction endonuclease subunit S [Streptomyces sp. NPDC001834]|uniref:restriction endonuclease subunit S n=1 Tax=unclassified Streptomyces TaxID=2593676 RepID=UPI00342687CC
MNWPVLPLKRLVDPARPITYGIVQAGPDTPGGVPYIRPADMTAGSGVPDRSKLLRTSPEIATSYRRSTVIAGDLVVSIGPSYGKVMVVPGELAGANLTQGTARVAAAVGTDVRFLYWALQTTIARQFWDSSVGGATFRALNLEPLGRTPVALVPLEDQRRIAYFLDAETDRVDALATKRGEQIRLLHERRVACLAACVSSHGPDSYRHPLTGNISYQWPVVQLRRVLPAVNVGVVINPSTYFEETGVPFIHGFNVRSGWINPQGMKFMSEESNEELHRSRLHAGDVLVVRAGAPGRSAVVTDEYDGANCASVLILRRSQQLLPEFLSAFINSPAGRGQVRIAQYGAAQEVISAAQTLSFQIPVPDLTEQRRRVTHLKRKLAALDHMSQKLERQSDLLTERRQALITAAVTGQFDVSTASGRNVTDGVHP